MPRYWAELTILVDDGLEFFLKFRDLPFAFCHEGVTDCWSNFLHTQFYGAGIIAVVNVDIDLTFHCPRVFWSILGVENFNVVFKRSNVILQSIPVFLDFLKVRNLLLESIFRQDIYTS